ncbi:cell adhesion molecule CEACAM5-like isoform X3 [Peromyscus maniculatus bairdii]|uniref:cell adhesion molecule CEACAM5-like isoform X3 n=1 Tax=Peromyscus maniculatus bairdii TaxID=230844 RepID=UPI003FD0BADA
MELSSVLPCKGCISWQGLLVTASLLTCWHLPTTVQVIIELVPPDVVEGENVLLLVRNLPENLEAFVWYKGVTNMNLGIVLYSLDTNLRVEGPEYSGRETVYRNGSLHLQDVTQKDTGFYTLRSINRHKEIISTTSIYLHVYSFLWSCGPLSTSAQPTIESVPPIIPEGGSVLLLVHNLPENLRSLFWYKGMIVSNNFEVARHIITMNSSVLGPAHNGGETVYSNGSLLLHNVTWKDTGLYTLRTLSTDMKTELAHVQLQMDTSLSPCCNPLNSSQLMIQPIPQYAAEGESVLLQVHNLPEDLQAFSWYKSMHSALVLKIVEYSRAMNSTTWGSAHSRREAVYTNGSLMLQDVTEEDAGMYTLEILNRDFKIDKADVHLHVNTSLFTCWHLSTTAQVTIESVPPQVVEGENVLLRANNLPENLLAFSWYKEVRNVNLRIALFALNTNQSVMGPEHSDREMVYSNGSLWLKNVTKKDTGLYTLRTVNRAGKIVSTTTMYFHVYTSLFTCGHPPHSAQPTIESVPPRVAEGGSVLLLVHNLPENLQALYWYKGVIAYKNFEVARHLRAMDSSLQGPAHSGREALFRNGSLLLYNVTLKDAGFYTLRTLTTDLKAEVAHVQLQVNTSVSTCSNTPTSTQVTIESVPQYVAEGKSVLFLVHNLPEDLQEFFWYKSVYRTDIFKIAEYNRATNSTIWGLAHSQREMVYSNGSLLIEGITEKDAGLYMLETLNKDYKIEKAFVQLHVNTSLFTYGQPPHSAKPTIESVPPSVAEGGSVLLLVHNLPENLQALYWYKGVIAYKNFEVARHLRAMDSSLQGPAHSGREALFRNGSLLLHNVTLKDAGFYTLRTLTTDLKAEVAHVQLQVNTSVSTCSNYPTSTRVTIESVPQYVAEGKSVLLLVHNLPEDLQEFYWYKSVHRTDIFEIAEYSKATNSTLWGLAHSQREIVYTNGSLLIEGITEKDAGLYMLETLNKDYKIEKAYVQLHVNKPVTQPFIRIIDTTVTVQSFVVLTCFSADPGISIHWIFNNQSLLLSNRMTLSPQNCQLSIYPVRMEDAGEYKCEVSNPVSSKTSLPVILVVKNE